MGMLEKALKTNFCEFYATVPHKLNVHEYEARRAAIDTEYHIFRANKMANIYKASVLKTTNEVKRNTTAKDLHSSLIVNEVSNSVLLDDKETNKEWEQKHESDDEETENLPTLPSLSKYSDVSLTDAAGCSKDQRSVKINKQSTFTNTPVPSKSRKVCDNSDVADFTELPSNYVGLNNGRERDLQNTESNSKHNTKYDCSFKKASEVKIESSFKKASEVKIESCFKKASEVKIDNSFKKASKVKIDSSFKKASEMKIDSSFKKASDVKIEKEDVPVVVDNFKKEGKQSNLVKDGKHKGKRNVSFGTNSIKNVPKITQFFSKTEENIDNSPECNDSVSPADNWMEASSPMDQLISIENNLSGTETDNYRTNVSNVEKSNSKNSNNSKYKVKNSNGSDSNHLKSDKDNRGVHASSSRVQENHNTGNSKHNKRSHRDDSKVRV